MLVAGTLAQARERLQELLREIVNRPEVAGDLADELSQAFYVLRNYSYFVDYQRKELGELCQEMDQL